ISRDRRIAVGEARAIVNVGRSVRPPRQRVLAAKMQRVALVMVQQKVARERRSAWADQAANDAAKAKSQLVGIGEIELRPVSDAWGTQRQLPAIDSRALNIDGEKNVGVVQAVVVEEVLRAIQEVVGVEHPALERNRDAELMLFVLLPVQG